MSQRGLETQTRGVYLLAFLIQFFSPRGTYFQQKLWLGVADICCLCPPSIIPSVSAVDNPQVPQKIAVRQRRVSHLKGMGLKLLRGWDPSSTSALIFREILKLKPEHGNTEPRVHEREEKREKGRFQSLFESLDQAALKTNTQNFSFV